MRVIHGAVDQHIADRQISDALVEACHIAALDQDPAVALVPSPNRAAASRHGGIVAAAASACSMVRLPTPMDSRLAVV